MQKAYIGVDGVAYRVLVKPKAITITRAEGPSHLCDVPQHAENWHDADWHLRMNSRTAPKGGGYDKHDFRIEWEDGSTYEGRYDLVHYSDEAPDLAAHVRQHVTWLATDERAIRHVTPGEIEQAKEWLLTYDVRQPPVPAVGEYETVADYRKED